MRNIAAYWRDRYWKDRGLAFKLIWINLVLIAVPLLLSSLLSGIGYSKSMQRNVGAYQADAVREFSANLDIYMNELALLSTLPYQTPDLLDYLERRNAGETSVYEERMLLEDFMRRIRVNGRIDTIGITLQAEKVRSYVEPPDSPGRFTEKYDPDLSAFYVSASSGRAVFAGPHTVRSDNGSTYSVFSAVRVIRSLESGSPLAVLKIDVPSNDLRERIANLSGDGERSVAVLDDRGIPIYESGTFPDSTGSLAAYRGAGTVTLGGGKASVLMTYVTSPVTGWTVLQAVPLSVLLRDAETVNRQMLLVGLACLVASILVSVLYSLRITRPLSLLRRSMKQVEKGEFGISIPVEREDEIGHLSRTFNLMVSRLGTLTYRLYETEIREKNAEIASLQSQINPHFLYNTLGSISMYAELEGNREVVSMTNHLSALLRYSMGGGRAEVTVREEIEHIRGYLAIQSIRYEERLRFRIEAAPGLMEQPVIRLTLQPVVENAIVHGLERGSGEVEIRIAIAEDGGRVVIAVEDNGPGMDDESLRRQNAKMEEGRLPEGPGGHGLVNVHRRLALKYGGGFGVSLEHSASGGIRALIRLPAIREEEQGEGREGIG
ncbi:cache domain-containing sensor histidine kinase [Saccharibacillus alkalitolerans]|uniref:Sensor histidine kinase n=1 Tax=Saccharibacillus alkalitolerans TaxID=2705290 RepID=A0ABX0F7I7_9BACL|nr:sensor histidine kinase [Saccharibacillus alkalitolerans]NGZ76345.1 sensor histidine kinase [Saccharibacillus alkalitolerans]